MEALWLGCGAQGMKVTLETFSESFLVISKRKYGQGIKIFSNLRTITGRSIFFLFILTHWANETQVLLVRKGIALLPVFKG